MSRSAVRIRASAFTYLGSTSNGTSPAPAILSHPRKDGNAPSRASFFTDSEATLPYHAVKAIRAEAWRMTMPGPADQSQQEPTNHPPPDHTERGPTDQTQTGSVDKAKRRMPRGLRHLIASLIVATGMYFLIDKLIIDKLAD